MTGHVQAAALRTPRGFFGWLMQEPVQVPLLLPLLVQLPVPLLVPLQAPLQVPCLYPCKNRNHFQTFSVLAAM